MSCLPKNLYLVAPFIMRYIDRHSEQAATIWNMFLESSDQVLSLFLKKFFKQNKKFGSRDRYQIRSLLYALVRSDLFGLGLSPKNAWMLEEELSPESIADMIIEECNSPFLTWVKKRQLTDNLTLRSYVKRYYEPSRVFAWVRDEQVVSRLYNFTNDIIVNGHQVSLPADSSISDWLPHNDYFIQDKSSQDIWQYLTLSGEVIWDTCCGSGGKNLMCYYHYPQIQRWASDIRPAILQNLKDRFSDLHWPPPNLFVCDLSQSNSKIPIEHVPIIFSDVPCTGSATWHRAPERAYLSTASEVDSYMTLQQSIITNAMHRSASLGQFIYITCSVFREENEAQIQFMLDNFPLQLEHAQWVNAFDFGGDALYMAVLRRTN